MLLQILKSRLSWMLLVGCAACQSRQPERDVPARPPRPAPVAAHPADSSRVVPTAAESLERLAVGDSIGPRPLEISPVGTAQLRAELAEQYAEADTVVGRFLVVKKLSDAPRVLYRGNRADTTWTELLGLLDHYEYGGEQQEVLIKQANLDGQGRPEALLSFSSASYGSGGGFAYASHYLLDVSSLPPRLLLQASTSYVGETFGGYVAMHGGTLDPADEYQGFERAVTLRSHEVVVGRIRQRGRHTEVSWRDELTALAPGRYRYQQGSLWRVVAK